MPEPMMHHLTDADLLIDFYGEGSEEDRRRTRAHLEQCEKCRVLDDELRAVLTAVDTAPISEPPSGFERAMWARIEPLLPVPQPWRIGPLWGSLLEFCTRHGMRRSPGRAESARRGWQPAMGSASISTAQPGARWSGLMPRMAVAASIGVLLIAAFAAGRVWDRPAQTSAIHGIDDAMLRERLLRAEVESHLERSQRMLVELVNADYQIGAPAVGDRARAADLVAAGRLYRRSALQVGDAEIGALLEDLERVLVEVANGAADMAPEELARLRRRIDEQDLMFRVRVVAREIKERGWSEGARE